MFVLDNGDKIRGDASTAAVIDYTFHGVVGSALTNIADGQLADATADLYTAGDIVTVTGVILANTHSAAVTVNLFLLPSGGTARRILAKDFSLGIGFSLHYDGVKVYVLNPSGGIVAAYVNHATSHTNGTDDIQDATAAQKGVATAAQITKLDGIATGATLYPDAGEQTFLDADHTKLDGIEALANVTDAVNIASSIVGVADKATPVNADSIGLIDSAAANVLKELTWTNVKATLKTYFDTLYQAVSTAVLKATFTTKGDILVTTGASTPIRLAVGGTNDHVLTVASGEASGVKWAEAAGGTNDYVKVSDVKAYNVDGGTFTSGAWRTRDINIEDSDTSAICSIASNQITLAAGTYICNIGCPAYTANSNRARLYNITDSSEVLLGANTYTTAGSASAISFITGKFTIAAQKIFEIHHSSTLTQATNGFGVKTNVAGIDSVYTVAEFRRIAT